MAPITWSVIECIQQKLVLKFEPWFGTRIRVCLVSVFPLNWQFLGFSWGNRFVVLCSWWKAWQMALWVRWWLTGRIGKTKNNAGASLHWAVNVNKTNCQTLHSKLWWNNFCVCCYQWLLQKYSDRLDKLDWFLWQFGCVYRIPKLDRFSQPIVVEIFVDILLLCWLWLGPSCVQSIYWLLSVVFA